MKLIYASLLAAGISLNGSAFAKTCDLTISGNDQMKFDKNELVVGSDCTEVKLTLKHSGKMKKNIMGHNWVLGATADIGTITKDGEKAGPTKDYIPADKKVLASTKLIGGGESTTVTFATKALKKGGDYTYVCTFPGHAALMKGKLVFK